jgi:hypothetical protein
VPAGLLSTYRRQPPPIPLPVQSAPPLHLFPESNAATIAAASVAVSSSIWAADITASQALPDGRQLHLSPIGTWQGSPCQRHRCQLNPPRLLAGVPAIRLASHHLRTERLFADLGKSLLL